jgi:hypothetical protein
VIRTLVGGLGGFAMEPCGMTKIVML